MKLIVESERETRERMKVEKAEAIPHESKIVWLDTSARRLPYVRETTMILRFRAKAPRTSRRLVAYATLRAVALSTTPYFRRRVWYLEADDPWLDSGGFFPTEAVNPLSIAAGKISEVMTDMAPRMEHSDDCPF